MSRIARCWLVEEGSTSHCFWRAHNHSFVLESDAARRKFLSLMAKYKDRYGIRIRSYCIMGTHPHVVCTSTRGQPGFSGFWQVVNYCFARWYNRVNGRRGQVVMQRTRSLLIRPTGNHLLRVMRYGDLNPVRAHVVRSPKDWPWSSYRHYAFGERNALIDDAPDYGALGRTAADRRRAYREFFSLPLAVALNVRRPDLVEGAFIGDPDWVRERLAAIPPRNSS